ncbi:luciferase family protein [Salinigranum sp. GCM10025319]|uniref:luciferase domain-containing protein n=1 Tax=Salinigranum sp. GCM10025319 TaxID=3252687 RepID=UPI003618D27C
MTTDIVSTVESWPGIVVEPHRFGGREFTLGGREVGHVHGTRQVDIPFPKRVRDVVVGEGFTSKHHLFPESGWVTKYLDSEADTERAVWLLRIAYLSHVAALQRRPSVDGAIASVDVAAEIDRMDLPGALRDLLSPDRPDSNGTATAAGR